MIPVKEIQEAIRKIGGHLGRECYGLLYLAIYDVRERQPERPQMKEIWAVVQKQANKKTATAVSKALERAVADLWESGDRDVLAGYQRSWREEAPPPKEFIFVLAECLWDGKETAATSNSAR